MGRTGRPGLVSGADDHHLSGSVIHRDLAQRRGHDLCQGRIPAAVEHRRQVPRAREQHQLSTGHELQLPALQPPVDPPPCPNCEALKEQLLDARRQVLNCEALKEQHSKAVNAATIAVLEIEKQARKKTEAAYADAHRALAEVEDVLREALRHVEGTRQDTWDALRSATKGGERGQD